MRKLGATFIAGVLLALVLAAAPQATLAKSRTIGGGVKQTNTTGGAKTDFEMIVSSPDTSSNCVGAGLGAALQLNGGSQIPPTAVTGNNTNSVTFSWTLAIANGDTVAAAFACTQENANSFTVNAYFTPKTNLTTAPTTGWKVTLRGEVYLANDRPAAIDFSDLRFQRPTSITISSLLSLVTGPSTGTLAKVSAGTVPAGSPASPGDVLVDYDPPLNPGDFLTSRLDAHFDDSGYSALNATVVTGHEQQGGVGGIAEAPDSNAPLPASTQSSGSSTPMYALFAGILLVAVAAAGAGWYARRRRLS